MKYSEIVENLKKQGYLRIYFPYNELIEKALVGFTDFLKKPLEERKLWTFQTNRGKNTETGYLLRDEPVNKMTGYAYDHKDVLHFQRDLYERLSRRGVPLSQGEREWLSQLTRLYHKALEAGESITQKLADKYFNIRFGKIRAHDKHVLRLLHYHMKEREGGLIGLGHVDESFLTLHLADNFPGLKAGTKGHTQLITAQRNISLVYPGTQFDGISKGEVSALWHEIIDTRSQVYETDPQNSSDLERLAVVFFFGL